jgi:hypothetical protein
MRNSNKGGACSVDLSGDETPTLLSSLCQTQTNEGTLPSTGMLGVLGQKRDTAFVGDNLVTVQYQDYFYYM